MRIPLIKGKGILLAPIFFVLFIFFLPISPSIKSIFLVCSIVSILFTPHYNQHLFYAFNTLWGRTALGLFIFILIACLWSQAPYSMQWMVVGKYFKVIYLPILAVGFIHPRVRNLSVNVYLASILLTCIISIIKSRFFTAGDAGAVFYNHIVTGFMVALASYLAGLFVFQYKGWLRIYYLLLVLLTSYQVLFINTGRTGYVVYFILMALLLLEKISFKKAVPGILLLCGVMLAAYYVSPVMQERVNDLLSDIKFIHHNNNENTSLGYRVQFHNYAKSLFMTHPVIGIGTGGFKYSASKDNPVPSWGNELTDPHSQYWLTLSEQGIIGLFFLLFFLWSLFITSFQLTETRPILIGILAAFISSALADTILCYSTAGFILVVMSALSLGELIEKRALKIAKGKESPSPSEHLINASHMG